MSRFPAYANPSLTLRDWVSRMRGLTFEENMQTQVKITEPKEGDLLSYSEADRIYLNDSQWQEWQPDVTPSGSLTVSNLDIRNAAYRHIGRSLLLSFYGRITFGGTANATITLSLPDGFRASTRTSTGTPEVAYLGVGFNDFDANRMGQYLVNSGDNRVFYYRLDGGTYTTGIARALGFQIEIELEQ